MNHGGCLLVTNSRHRESNPEPQLYESCALPLSYVGKRAAHGRVNESKPRNGLICKVLTILRQEITPVPVHIG